MKKFFSYLPLCLIIVSGVFVLTGCWNKNTGRQQAVNAPANVVELTQEERAMQKAREIYAELKKKGNDFSAGPCLTENLMPDWVADIAHNPRQAVDDNPENQCQSFRVGQAHHFVELDPDGAFIRAY